MNDFNYDVREKKSLVASARRRVCGSKSKRCTLPSDNLTPAQRRKLDGPVEVYTISKPMSWDQFKSMPADLQQAHLDYLARTFSVGATTVSRVVFGLSDSALRQYLQHAGLHYPKAGRASEDRLRRLSDWLGGTGETDEIGTETEGGRGEPIPEPEPENTLTNRAAPDWLCESAVTSVTLDLDGDPTSISNAILCVMNGRPASVSVTIRFK